MIFFLNQNIFVKDLSVCFFLTFQIDFTSSTMDIYVSIYVKISNILKEDKIVLIHVWKKINKQMFPVTVIEI